MRQLAGEVDRLAAETAFSGVVRVDQDVLRLTRAYGWAHRGLRIANDAGTRFGLASGTKGLTALVVVSLVEEGLLHLGTTARSLLGPDLPLIGDDVTIEHLLAHRSGIGDYLDEEQAGDVTDHVLAVPVHELAATEDYLRVLDGHPTKFPAGQRFSYSNGGYVVLALIAERASGTPFPELVGQRVCGPAGMAETGFLRSDEPPGGTALGYLEAEGLRTNVFHLPVCGSGDGGISSTVADVHRLWEAFVGGGIVSSAWVAEMVRPRSDVPAESRRYGLGFWLHRSRDVVMLEGSDAGVSFRTACDLGGALTYTVISNTSRGAWPLTRRLDALLLA